LRAKSKINNQYLWVGYFFVFGQDVRSALYIHQTHQARRAVRGGFGTPKVIFQRVQIVKKAIYTGYVRSLYFISKCFDIIFIFSLYKYIRDNYYFALS